MYCPTCQNQNNKNALFCKSCGTKLYHPQQEKKSRNSVSDKLLIIFCFVFFLFSFAKFAVNFVGFGSGSYTIYHSLLVLCDVSIILPAMAIKNKALKFICVILISLVIIYGNWWRFI